ncbi:MAG: copper chaperone PCu(A)C [Asticcacaulis sp.]|uniref:copper chaperone PCu(A)C n=1 Tax=Asticcacaulis sp. TaxID=1872648 RepID=UPI0039E50B4C
MRAILVMGLACLALTACEKVEKHTTTVSSTSDVNGVVTAQSLNLTDYAMRAALGNNPNTAAYVTITNKGNTDDRLISASCNCATTTTLHTMTMNGSTMEMAEAKDGFVIRSGDTLVFAPGGNHIMLENLTQRPKAGDTVDVTLVFEKAGPITLSMPVSNTPLAKAGEATGMDHGDMKM